MSMPPANTLVEIDELKGRIEPQLLDRMTTEPVEIKKIAAVKLLAWQRFDLGFKLLFLEFCDRNPTYAKRIYKDHISAFSFGTFKEPNNAEKTTLESFLETFLAISVAIAKTGFDSAKSLLPITREGFIQNGAHRLAASIFSKNDVYCVNTGLKGKPFDYRFFLERGIPTADLDAAAATYVKWAENIYLALIWPAAEGQDEALLDAIGNVVYMKQIDLNHTGAHNLMPQVYPNEKWIGSIEDNFNGSLGKVVECFKGTGPLRAVLFHADSLQDVLAIKDKVRDVFQIGKHSIHITDTKEEVLRLSTLLFNENSIHFLNNAKPNEFPVFHAKLREFKKFLELNNIDAADAVLDSGIVLAAYGIRKPNDIDYISQKLPTIQIPDINSHSAELHFHAKSEADLIYDPANYFYFQGIKFVSFQQTLNFKEKRAGEKDIHDVSVMRAMQSADPKKIAATLKKQRLFYLKHKLKYLPIILTIRILKRLGLYSAIRKKYHQFKRKRNG